MIARERMRVSKVYSVQPVELLVLNSDPGNNDVW